MSFIECITAVNIYAGEHLVSTATFLLIATLWGATGMGFWHGALFYEINRVTGIVLKLIQSFEVTQIKFRTDLGTNNLNYHLSVSLSPKK